MNEEHSNENPTHFSPTNITGDEEQTTCAIGGNHEDGLSEQVAEVVDACRPVQCSSKNSNDEKQEGNISVEAGVDHDLNNENRPISKEAVQCSSGNKTPESRKQTPTTNYGIANNTGSPVPVRNPNAPVQHVSKQTVEQKGRDKQTNVSDAKEDKHINPTDPEPEDTNRLSTNTVHVLNPHSKYAREKMQLTKTQTENLKNIMKVRRMKPEDITSCITIFPLKSSESSEINVEYKISKKPIGKGNYGTVYPATVAINDEDENKCAVKLISGKTFNITEVLIPLVLGDPVEQVPKLFASLRLKDEVLVFMELASGIHLKSIETTWSSRSVIAFIHAILLGLKKMHSNLCAHMDLKPHNLGFWDKDRDPRRPVIFDFGSSKVDTEPPIPRHIGNHTTFYLAPEFDKMHAKDGDHCASAYFKFDIWALGLTGFSLTAKKEIWNETRHAHFTRTNKKSRRRTYKENQLHKFITDKGEEEADRQLTKLQAETDDPLKLQLIDLLRKMLSEETDRITAQDAIHHPVFEFLKSETCHVKFIGKMKSPYEEHQRPPFGCTVFEDIVPRGTTIDQLKQRQDIREHVKYEDKLLDGPSGKEVDIIDSDISLYITNKPEPVK